MKIGFLPLYVKLYDDVAPGCRPRMEAYYATVAQMLRDKGVEVVESPFCRLADEFAATVKKFEDEKVDAIVTLHIAYSPSLQAIDALAGTDLPIVVLDTTPTMEFDNMQSPGEIMYCHGIHGVMDMCTMLTKRGKAYAIAAGHYEQSDVLDRTLGYVRAAIAAKALNGAKVARVGGPFAGMGDFVVPFETLKSRFGIEAYDMDLETVQKAAKAVTAEQIEAEKAENAERFDFADNVQPEEYDVAVRSCLTMRSCIEQENLTAFTATFLGMGEKACGIETMPFIECCKAMERGIGYAGEGDTLTAAFTGAFLQSYPETSFVEIFCPDWKHGLVLLSHMGEVNYRIINNKPLLSRVGRNYVDSPYHPYAAYARMKGGKGVYVNITPVNGDFRMVICETEMKDYDTDNFPTSMRGWMRTGKGSCAKFLEKHSEYAGTHHSIFVYGATAAEMKYFAKLLGMECVEI